MIKLEAIVRKLSRYIITYPGYRPAVYVDVDGTLLLEGGLINQTIVSSVRLIKGSFEDEVKIVLWSAGGERHALDACKAAQLENVVDYCIAKPIVAIDDMGFNGPMILADVLDEELIHQAGPTMGLEGIEEDKEFQCMECGKKLSEAKAKEIEEEIDVGCPGCTGGNIKQTRGPQCEDN